MVITKELINAVERNANRAVNIGRVNISGSRPITRRLRRIANWQIDRIICRKAILFHRWQKGFIRFGRCSTSHFKYWIFLTYVPSSVAFISDQLNFPRFISRTITLFSNFLHVSVHPRWIDILFTRASVRVTFLIDSDASFYILSVILWASGPGF